MLEAALTQGAITYIHVCAAHAEATIEQQSAHRNVCHSRAPTGGKALPSQKPPLLGPWKEKNLDLLCYVLGIEFEA